MSSNEPGFTITSAGSRGRRSTDRHGQPSEFDILSTPAWNTVLNQFSHVTGLTTTLFDAELDVRAGTFTPTPMSKKLAAADCWKAERLCYVADRTVARAALEQVTIVHRREIGDLALFGVPLLYEQRPIGAVVAGWAFDSFADPIVVDRLARSINVAFNELWVIAREQPPISPEKLKICAGLLQMVSESLVQERAETLNQQARAQELLVLNNLAQSLTAANTLEEIGMSVIQAALALAHAKEARLLVVADDDQWQVAAQVGLSETESIGPASAQKRGISSRLRVPVEASNGKLLGVIEITETEDFPSSRYQIQMSALAAQTAIALQKQRLFTDLERERIRLERANRTKDEFLSVLSHELRTPLTPILGWVTMLERTDKNSRPDTFQTALSSIRRNAHQELHLVDELLDLSRILNEKVLLEPEIINPIDALASAFTLLQSLSAPRKLKVRMDTNQNLPHISVDPKRLQQILANLISNAVKFTPDGGLITLAARRAGDLWVEFSVSDTGMGIDPTVLPYIFDRFQQADTTTTRRFGGLGIGLSVVRGLTELHGGHVHAESGGPGKGATFTVRFPVVAAPETAVAASLEKSMTDEEVDAATRSHGERVLVVDDSQDTLTVLRAMLEAKGFIVETAESAEVALELARNSRPDVIISDIGMPGSDGFALLEQLRQQNEFQQLPVIALTGYASALDRSNALAAGFAEHLSKPVELPVLIAVLNKVLASGSEI